MKDLIPAFIILLISFSFNIFADPPTVSGHDIKITGVAPRPGTFGTLGFTIESIIIKGVVTLRCPETVNSSMGLHYIDHDRPDMPMLEGLLEPVVWSTHDSRPSISYKATTKEGLSILSTADIVYDGVFISLRIENNTGRTLKNVSSQVCLSLNAAESFNKTNDLSRMYTWVNDKQVYLSTFTPTAKEKKREPWIRIPTEGLRQIYKGPMDHENAWWVVDQTADHPLLAIESENKNATIAIAWNDPAAMLMTNSRIPCLHAGPEMTFTLDPGEAKSWHGKVYITENPSDVLLKQFKVDRAQNFMCHDLFVKRNKVNNKLKSNKSLRVGAVRVAWNENEKFPEETIDRGFKLAEKAVSRGAQLIVFPENFLHSGNPDEQKIPGGKLVKIAEEFAAEHHVYLCSGMIESWKFDWRDEYFTYLAAIVVGPEGYISKHRKVDVNMLAYNTAWKPGMPKTDMAAWSGDDFAMHTAGKIDRMGIMICRDSNSSWAWTRVLTQNPEIIVSPNFRDSVTKYGVDFGAMAAISGVPIVVANGHPQSESMIINRNGEVLEIVSDKEDVIVADIDLAPEDPSLKSFDVIHNTFYGIPNH